jgi:hypothetical protein
MSVKIQKGVLPYFLGGRQYNRRRTFAVVDASGATLFCTVFTGSNCVHVWDPSVNKHHILTAGGPGEIQYLQCDRGLLAVSQTSGALTIFDLANKHPKRYVHDSHYWFLCSMRTVIAVQAEKVTRICCDAQNLCTPKRTSFSCNGNGIFLLQIFEK